MSYMIYGFAYVVFNSPIKYLINGIFLSISCKHTTNVKFLHVVAMFLLR